MTSPSPDLFNNTSFQHAGAIDQIVPSAAGVYAIQLQIDSALPEPFASFLNARATRVIYIGKATSLNSRMLGNELRGLGHGTFFRSIGAVLGYMPKAGSLADKVNMKNFSFEQHDRDAIIEWINTNLEVAWKTMPAADIPALESALILEHTPLLNLHGNPRALVELKNLRSECREIASAVANTSASTCARADIFTSSNVVTPEALARELGYSGRTIRGFLRLTYGHVKYQRWELSPEQVKGGPITVPCPSFGFGTVELENEVSTSGGALVFACEPSQRISIRRLLRRATTRSAQRARSTGARAALWQQRDARWDAAIEFVY